MHTPMWLALGVSCLAVASCAVSFNDYPVVARDTGAASVSGGTPDTSNGQGGASGGGTGDDTANANSSSLDGGSSTGTGGGSSNGPAATATDTSTDTSTSAEMSATGTSATTGSSTLTDACQGDETSCSACAHVLCPEQADCCIDVGFYAARTAPTWLSMPELVTSFSESPTAAELGAAFSAADQVAGISYRLNQAYQSSTLSIQTSNEGAFNLVVNLEHGEDGCSFRVFAGVLYNADICWGAYASTSWNIVDIPFSTINVQLETREVAAGGPAALSVTEIEW